MMHTRYLAAILLLIFTPCCSGSGAAPDIPTVDPGIPDLTADETAAEPTSHYVLEATLWDGSDLVLERDLSGKDPSSIYAFGSTHIAPAVSLAMTDTIYDPYAIVTINIGVVVGSVDHPIQCGETGIYPFGSDSPPAIEVFYKNIQYESGVDGSVGSLTVTNWTTLPGVVFEGKFEGRLMLDTGQPDKYADVSGSFRFTLPEPAGGV